MQERGDLADASLRTAAALAETRSGRPMIQPMKSKSKVVSSVDGSL
jgi:hypothetical protein